MMKGVKIMNKKIIQFRRKLIELYEKTQNSEYSANRRPLVTVEKSTKYAEQVHFIKILNTLRSPL